MNPAKTIADSIEEAVDAKIAKSQRGGQKTVTAVYCGKDSDGKPYVQIPGADDTTPIRRMSVQADVGDTVTVTIENGMAVVDSNVSNPSASSSNLQAVEVKTAKAQQAADEAVEKVATVARKTEAAMAQALSASTIASEAQEVADATNQHFWDDDNGAHVTDVTQEEWITALEDNFSDLSTSKPYHNSLFNSLGMLFRSALNNLVSITRSAIAFYDGQGNQSSNIVAEFGANGAQIGKSADGHAVLTPTELTFSYGTYDAVNINSKTPSGTAGHSYGRITLDGEAIGMFGSRSFVSGDDYLSIYSNGSSNNLNGCINIKATGADGRYSSLYCWNDEIDFCSSDPQNSKQTNLDITENELYWCLDGDQSDRAFEFNRNGNLTIAGTATFGSPLAASSGGTGVSTATANRVFAAPDGSNGAPTFRALVADDLPVVTAAKGGTGETSLKSSANALIGSLDAVSSTNASDSTDFITSATNGGTTTFYRRNALFVWNWIKGKIDSVYGLGTVVTGSDTVASVANTTATQICSVSLAPGTWVVTYTASFASNATGRRNIKLYAGTSTTIDPARSATCQAVNGSATVLSRTAVVTVSSTTSYYLNAYQASGGALSVDGDIQAVRIA